MDDSLLSMLKIAIAVLGGAFFVWHTRHARSGRESSKNLARVALAVVAMSAYFHFFDVPFKGYYHRWEMFHYYLGSKYSSELGYEGLYRCAAIADAATGNQASVLRRRARDLDTDTLVRAGAFLDEPETCTNRFSSARWTAFQRDVVWFRGASGGGEWWEEMQQDHGYNASPVWTMLARPLANLAPAGDGFMKALAAIDVVLMAGSFGALAWAFGSRIAAVAALFWGTQAASEFFWTGGAFLRQDWLFLLVVGASLIRKKCWLAAGFMLTAAGLLRVFPLLLWVGPLVVVVSATLRQHKITRAHRLLLIGGVLAAAVLGGASIVTEGPGAYRAFAQRMALRTESPISNHMSLRTLFSVTEGGRLEQLGDPSLVDPLAPWAQARRERLAETHTFYWLTAGALVAFLVMTVRRIRSLWIALCLSLLLIPALTDPSCYYYSAFLLAAPLCRAQRGLEVVLAAVAGSGQLLSLRFGWMDDRFVALAALYVLFAIVLVGAFARPPVFFRRYRTDRLVRPRFSRRRALE